MVCPSSAIVRSIARMVRAALESRAPVGSSASSTVGRGDHGAGDRDPLLLSTGQLARSVPSAVGKADPLEHTAHLAPARSTTRQPQRHRDVLLGAERPDQVEVLEDEADRGLAEPGEGGLDAWVMSCPAIRTRPCAGRSRPPARCNSVDLPEPDGPITAVHDPLGNVTCTSSSATTRSVTGAVDAADATELDRGRPSRVSDPRRGRGSRAVPDVAVSDVSGLS